VNQLPIAGDLLRGSLLERVVRHRIGCPKRTRGEGPGVRSDGELCRRTDSAVQRAARAGCRVRRWLRNYQELKEEIEAVCELNHDLLRPDAADPKVGGA
jgi:hypothetical protein